MIQRAHNRSELWNSKPVELWMNLGSCKWEEQGQLSKRIGALNTKTGALTPHKPLQFSGVETTAARLKKLDTRLQFVLLPLGELVERRPCHVEFVIELG